MSWKATVVFVVLAGKILGSTADSMTETSTGTKAAVQTINWNDTGPIKTDRELEFPRWIDEWTAPVDMRNWFPYYLTGYDEEGSPVYVSEYGNYKFAEALASSSDSIGNTGRQRMKELILKYMQQGTYNFLRHGVANNSQGVVLVIDFNGFSLASYADPIAIQIGLRQMTMLDRIYNVLNYAFLINLNFAAENFIRLAKPFIGNFLERCEIFGSRRDQWLPRILNKIPASQLPPWYGGVADWKPVWLGGTPAVISRGNVTNP